MDNGLSPPDLTDLHQGSDCIDPSSKDRRLLSGDIPLANILASSPALSVAYSCGQA